MRPPLPVVLCDSEGVQVMVLQRRVRSVFGGLFIQCAHFILSGQFAVVSGIVADKRGIFIKK